MLLDKHGRRHTYLRISLTERCNLRCTYCMPAEGAELTPSGKLLTAAEARAAGGCLHSRGTLSERCDTRADFVAHRLSALRASLLPLASPRFGSQARALLRRMPLWGSVAASCPAGGEPTVRPDLEEIAARLGALPGLRDLAITSNGILLAKKLPGTPRLLTHTHAAHTR